MNIYIDESGSINNHAPNNKYFVIALIHPTNKDALKRAYKRFVSSNHDDLLALDQDKLHPKTGQIVKKGEKMFQNGDFHELKGSQFDREMKQKFVDFFCRKPSFELYYRPLGFTVLLSNSAAVPYQPPGQLYGVVHPSKNGSLSRISSAGLRPCPNVSF